MTSCSVHGLTNRLMLSTKNKQVNGSVEPDSSYRNEGELVNDWLDRGVRLGPAKKQRFIVLRTHKHVDADAAFSAALMMEFLHDRSQSIGLTLEFVPASYATDAPHILAVDMLEGRNAVKGLEQGSAFGLLVDVLGKQDELIEVCFRQWAEQLNLTDSGNKCDDRVILAELVSAWKANKLSDKNIVNRARELIRGKLLVEKWRNERQTDSQDVPIVSSVAIVVDKRIDRITLFKRGAKAIVQQSDCGMCIHLSRKIMDKGHNLTELKHSLPESWFVHPSGFLAAFGTPKAPRDPAESGIPIEALFILVQNWIGGI